MCILFIAINQHPDHPLIVCANRDEFYQRATKTMHHWSKTVDDWQITAGKDMQAGGTWFGVAQQSGDTEKGIHFSALTNIRNRRAVEQNKDKSMRSRGELVSMALAPDNDIDLDWLLVNSSAYNPFNLIYQRKDISEPAIFCFNATELRQQRLEDGFHAICNGNLNDKWPKMTKGEKALEAIVNQHQALDPYELFKIMQDQTQAPDELLPDTGVGIEWERLLSSIFIQSESYGTRSTTLFFTHRAGGASLYELSYDEQGNAQNVQEFHLTDKANHHE
ncbi:NRDE family protein [Thalassotalea litorea]|uniref:NRDE family protein n=1 Tax=Thalassotalea litorea TaxID=2020715 RepID=A0A5R9IVI6_9GAMM|nr:NRDE family protein [Thalassotalea litorea]TLU67186.1 NRDE family protein [Thalassotalea litorea]